MYIFHPFKGNHTQSFQRFDLRVIKMDHQAGISIEMKTPYLSDHQKMTFIYFCCYCLQENVPWIDFLKLLQQASIMMLHAVMISTIVAVSRPSFLFISQFKVLYTENLPNVENLELISYLSSKIFHTSYHIIKNIHHNICR